ncbi:hypothetical protein ATY41_06180 [Leifsonia xyli subsp. xyli]|uniref:Uncharacterized protein n=2 Tax=Leifsonia xyli subsp. xyli TaxID=59736 RepID=Q6ABY9_LEIXX|nr:hypothetical protein [Leifsonia xyli]AAT90103.1 hypothetical protein Lxx24950 [Leifsonia xyli subsp. xyli str. CTCB07]ODA89306.1 hypothetical protein ATY41_06180 [Leifsonia xyli subsp. xyli]
MGGEGTSVRMRPALLWSGVSLLLLLAFADALGAVQRTFYSPSGFVTSYLEAIADHDVRAAVSMPGAAPTPDALKQAGLPENASRELLRSDVLPQLTDIAIVSDRKLASGEHHVAARARVDGRPVTATFAVRPSGSVLGILPTWSFATTPLSVARIAVAHADSFTIAGHTLSPRAAAPGQPPDAFTLSADYLVLAPARYDFGHTSAYSSAAPAVVTGVPGRVVETTINAQPTPRFAAAVQKQLNSFLDQCARQRVLQPAGCPFGVDIDDRVQGAPAWRMVAYPEVRLHPGATAWTIDQSGGVVHLSVTVQSLFDGTVQQRESDERMTVSLTSVTIRPDGSLRIVVAR